MLTKGLSLSKREPWLLAAASMVVLAAAPAQYLGRQHDDILFVVASHALSLGRYVLFTSPGAPPLYHVWPGVPAVLLPVTWAFGESTAAYQLWAALVLAACPWAIWLWLGRRAPRPVAVLVPLLFASSPLVLSQAGCVMSEAPYTLLAAIALYLLEAPRLDAARAGWVLLALVLSRPASLSALPGAAGRLVLARRWREASRLLGPAAGGLALWLAWSCMRSGRVQEAGEWAASYHGRGLGALAALPAANARFFLDALGSSFLPVALSGGALAAVVGTGVWGAALWGAGRALAKRQDEPAALMLAVALAMHLFWGWQYERYMIPLLPLVLAFAAEGLGRKAVPVLGALLACQLLFQTPRFLGRAPAATPELAATYTFLREHARPGDVLASPLYVRDGYYAGMPSLPLADQPGPEELAALSKRWRVRFILWQDLDLGLSLDKTAELRLTLEHVSTLLRDRRRFRPAFSDDGGRAVLYELR